MKLGGLPPVAQYLRSVWERRQFAYTIASGQLRSQNFDTVLGNLWHLLNPLMLVAVYFLMFGVILDISRGMPNFIGFLAVGIFVYSFLQRSATSGAGAVVGNMGLIRSLQFPRILLPLAAVLKESLAFGSTLVVMVIVVVSTELRACSVDPSLAACSTFVVPITLEWFMFIPVYVLMLLFGFGAAFVTARLTDHIRDTANVLPYLFRITFYVSGVLYPVERFVRDPLMRTVFNANPFYVYVTLVRHYLMPTYSAPDLGRLWISGLSWAVGLFVFGVFYFRAREKSYGRG